MGAKARVSQRRQLPIKLQLQAVGSGQVWGGMRRLGCWEPNLAILQEKSLFLNIGPTPQP